MTETPRLGQSMASVPLVELCVCEHCGHLQADPNWCHRCGHRVRLPEWAKQLLTDLQTLKDAIQDHLDTFGYDNREGLADALVAVEHQTTLRGRSES